jgi:hypothetical protein
MLEAASQRQAIILEILRKLGGVFNREVTLDLIEAWEYSLVDLSDSQLLDAVKRVLTSYTGSFMPTPAQFREFAFTQTGFLSLEAEAEVEWISVVSSIKRYGPYKSIYFKNSCVSEFVKRQGGWPSVCQWLQSEYPWKRKEFIGDYCSLKRSGQRFSNHARGLGAPDEIRYVGNYTASEKKAIQQQHKALTMDNQSSQATLDNSFDKNRWGLIMKQLSSHVESKPLETA